MEMVSLSPAVFLLRVITLMTAGGYSLAWGSLLARERVIRMALAFRFCIPRALVEIVCRGKGKMKF